VRREVDLGVSDVDGVGVVATSARGARDLEATRVTREADARARELASRGELPGERECLHEDRRFGGLRLRGLAGLAGGRAEVAEARGELFGLTVERDRAALGVDPLQGQRDAELDPHLFQ